MKVTSAAKSSSFADETSAFSVISSENQWPPIISSESYSNQEISGDSTSENCDATSTNDKEASLEHDEYASSNGKSTYYGKRVSAEGNFAFYCEKLYLLSFMCDKKRR